MKTPSCHYCGLLIHDSRIRTDGVDLHSACYDRMKIAQLEEEVAGLRQQLEEKIRKVAHFVTPCCWMSWTDESDFKGPIYWNPYNRVVQCHVCGQVYDLSFFGVQYTSAPSDVQAEEELNSIFRTPGKYHGKVRQG